MKIGVIGLGSIGLRHAKNLADLGHQVLAWDPDAARCKEALYYKGNVPIGICDCIHEVTYGDEDGIVIASPTRFHIDHLSRALREHTAPVFIEKPIADSDRVLHLSDLIKSRPTMVGYNLRLHSCVKKAKEWLDSGAIGTPLWANFTCAQYNDKPAYLRDGVILNWSHEIDLALYLLGSATVAASSTRLTDGKDDMTDILLTHEGGCRSSIHLDYLTDPEWRHFMIYGADGTIQCDLPSRSIRLFGKSGSLPNQEFIDSDGSYDQDYLEEMQAFIDRLDGKKTIGATGAEGLAVLDICLKVREQAGL